MTGAGSQQRAPGGLEAVYIANRDALMRFLRARGAGDSAEDLVQLLWLKVSAAPSTPIAEPLSYLYRAANNLMISSYRSAVRRDSRDRDWDSSATGELAVSAEETVSARQQIDAAERRLRELGPRILRTFVLFRVDGMPQRQIAAQLNVSLSAVEKDLQRAYRAIADLRSEFDAG
ncbi:MAG: sigma-70 family RNA polymerase sigma factor [Pseudomonadota bacterium]|nr:sigma-70 family RNA polymerase sigma factor [Pseudomonadota bacterium]